MSDKHLHPVGWFARAFALTLGVLAAVTAASVVSWAILISLAASAPSIPLSESPPGNVLPAVVVQAQQAAMPQLRRMGLKRFSGHAAVRDEGARLTLIANSPDEAGEMRPVTFTFDTSGDEWALVEYSLDGTKYRRKP